MEAFRYEIPTRESHRRGEDDGGANIVDVLCLPYTQQAVIGIDQHIMLHIGHLMNNKRFCATI